MDQQNPDTLYVLASAQIPFCCRTDIFKSTNGGMSWSMTASWGGNDVSLLSIDPRNSSTLYAAAPYRATISKSTDGGVTWTESGLPPEAVQSGDDDFWGIVISMAVDPQDSSVVYATGSGGIFKSTDGGANWTTMNSGLAPHTCIGRNDCFGEPYQVDSLVIDPQKSTVYAASRVGILRSADGGSSWSQVNTGLPAPTGANSLALDPVNPSKLFAAGGGGVYTITFTPEIH
jgi:photosystem II stability/assembly factor-like uncharacterized protein